MSQGPGQDPGGGPDPGSPPGSSQELSDLKDQFEQQQVLIAQLKEMIRKSDQTSVTQEKVDEYINTLSKRGRAKKTKKEDDNRKTIDIPASQKISLLRQQVEENKLRLAERGKSQKGIEEMVSQLKAQLDDSQQLISLTPLNLSLQDTKVEYSESSSAQDLYMVLLTKEKRISDLLAKVQKLETSVIDLQENVKEKDSVIDARTKAITLMTENLSRKSKTTLDSLDETKEQMRKMQENFIELESEMKARQMKLLDDLRQKNYEIAELQEINSGLERQVSGLKEKQQSDEEDEENFIALRLENSRLSEKIKELEKAKEDNTETEEISKLKKQLEESNKNMIKVKAQHKSKVKDLTKKIEAFKKVSDVNAEVVKLESENCRLNQKIAELEEEKGSLQLKLVESDSGKGSESAERKNELEEMVQDHSRILEERDKVISILEAEISRSKTEVEALTEKLNGLSHLENAQVTSEMASIQYEEQMDSLENDKKQLTIENENLTKEKEQLLEMMDQLKKEKQEISTKLEHYIQENIELIDKLEKLSAEKVSSAESIEIVEGLTQQEKLELAAYQKNLDMVGGNLKSSEENLPQADLNESVNELTEETSELLQKIELFTVERREVMEKMEQLKQENVSLSLKIEEIENNRDILAETYEQLQNEKEALDVKLETIETENVRLKEKKDQNPEENNRIRELEEEIAANKIVIEEKRSELENIHSQLEERSKENSQLNNTIIDLNRTLADLENDNKSLQMKLTQLEEHKTDLSQIIDKNQEELEAIRNTEWENRRLLESKDNEITKLMKERDNTESVILDLQRKGEKYQKIISDLKDKFLLLQKQLEDNSDNLKNITGPMEAKIGELTTKNKEQLEKMKKIAANLKKKTQAYQELEEKFKETHNRHDVELKTSLQQLQDLEAEVSRLQKQFDDKCEEARVLQENTVSLQNTIADLKVKADKNNELNLQQELLLTKENLGSVESSLQAKIQELEMIIETQESELVKSRERVNKLEEGISFVEERRLSLERKATDLGAQLEEKEITCEEISRSEDLLERRLAALTAHDEAIEKKLEDAVSENQELNQHNRKLREKNEKLKKKIEEMKENILSIETQQNVVEDLEGQNQNLKKQIHNFENELKILQNDYDKMIEENNKINVDWQNQFEEILAERTELMVKCEKFAEELKEISEKEIGFNDELIEYKAKLENSETEIRNYEERIQILSKETEEMDQIKKIVSANEDTIKSYETKLQELNEVVGEKEQRIETLAREKKEAEEKQRANNLATFFDNVPPEDPTIVQLREEIAASRIIIQELEEKEARLQNEVLTYKTTVEELQGLQSQETVPAVSTQENIPTFVWSGDNNDPFDFIEQTKVTPVEAPPQPIENTQQELLDKIKTLEFMLFNAEKEKDDAHLQCQELTNELTRLIYEKQMPTGLESQILQESDIRDTADTSKELEKIEFEDTKPNDMSSFGPVIEEPVEAKEAYLCYGDEREAQVAAVESQILSEADIVETPSIRQELVKLEFEETKPPVSSTEPIKEEPYGSKEAYLCYNTFGENDDGWGWGPEEAKLEEEHAQKENLDELKNRIRVLELERENHMEEIRQLQVKSGKLIKKLKEFKVKNEELSQRKKSESDLFNLDDTIQEELKLQIQQVEKKLKETSTELEKEKNEKSTILKRIDVLTAANERMVEMKEKQDIELLGWQQNYRELHAKLERFEWGDDGFSSVEKPAATIESNDNREPFNKKIEELNDTIKELSLDNEELQALLEEQRKLRIGAEKSAIQIDRSEELRQLNNQLQLSAEEKKQLQEQVNELIKKNTELSGKFEILEKESAELEILSKQLQEKEVQISSFQAIEQERELLLQQLQEKNAQIDSLKSSVVAQSALEAEREHLLKELQDRNALIDNLNGSIVAQSAIETEKEILLQELQQKNAVIDSMNASVTENEIRLKELQAQIDSLNSSVSTQSAIEEERAVLLKQLQEKEVLIKELQEKNVLRDSVDSQMSSLKQELDDQTRAVETLFDEKKILGETITTKDAEIVKLASAMEQMTQEWDLRIDQRGSDVAESWKLHLDSRETEFAQIEQLLRKEINELEEKTNALVNENNELRKNVDAEIRNEVDRVAALQQQISDRQQCVNELTKSLEVKQAEIENLRSELQSTKKYLDEEKESGANLTKELSEKESLVVSLRTELEEIKVKLSKLEEEHSGVLIEVERLNGLVEERNQTVASLNTQIQDMRNLKDYENENTHNLQQNLVEFQQIISNINAQLQTKSLQLDEKERELGNLRLSLEEKGREHAFAIERLTQEYRASINEQSQEIDSLRRRLADNEAHYEELLQTKDSELGSVYYQVDDQSELLGNKNKELEELNSQLNIKVQECAELQSKINEQTVLVDEENKQLIELRAIIEEQVLKIEELKKELFEKSNDFDSFIAEMDISRKTVEPTGVPRSKPEETDDLTEPVSRAELDLALYMLHQRDVRCEELTVELTQLLEERDTLQLRLSNVIREKEELGRQVRVSEESELQTSVGSSEMGAVPKIKTEVAVEAFDPLRTKLSELRTVGYKKDKTLVDEQELRRYQQLSIMQQHRDAASKLPPEAAARLVDASYTLSRDVQSPSKVLLNWLWGRSTPKVNNV